MRNLGIRYEDDLIERLKDPEFAAYYLSEVLNDTSEPHKERILLALKRMAKAYGVSALTQEIGRSPKALYVSLSKNGNPTMDTFLSILEVLGIQLQAKVREEQERRPKKKRRAASS